MALLQAQLPLLLGHQRLRHLLTAVSLSSQELLVVLAGRLVMEPLEEGV
jgi:hypothetical protein